MPNRNRVIRSVGKKPKTPVEIWGTDLMYWTQQQMELNSPPAVENWIDLGPKKNHPTQANSAERPDRQDNVIKTLPAIQFDGIDEHFLQAGAMQGVFQNDFLIMCIVSMDDGQPAADTFIYGVLDTQVASNSEILQLRMKADGRLQFQYRANNVTSTPAETNAVFWPNGQTPFRILGFFGKEGESQLDIYWNKDKLALDATNDGDATGVNFNNFANTISPAIGARNDDGVVKNHSAMRSTAWLVGRNATENQLFDTVDYFQSVFGKLED